MSGTLGFSWGPEDFGVLRAGLGFCSIRNIIPIHLAVLICKTISLSILIYSQWSIVYDTSRLSQLLATSNFHTWKFRLGSVVRVHFFGLRRCGLYWA